MPLTALTAFRAAQPVAGRLRVGVLSNWDERLPQLLDALGATPHLDFVLTSRQAAVEKPAAEIFARARELGGVAPGARAVHVGDSVGTDVRGAATAGPGWEAVYVKKRIKEGERAELDATPHTHLEDLSDLPRLLGCV